MSVRRVISECVAVEEEAVVGRALVCIGVAVRGRSEGRHRIVCAAGSERALADSVACRRGADLNRRAVGRHESICVIERDGVAIIRALRDNNARPVADFFRIEEITRESD